MEQTKKTGTILLILCFPLLVLGQSKTDEPDTDGSLVDPLNFSYHAGTGFLFSKRYGSAYNFYFGTSASYRVTPKFTLEFGTAVNFSSLTDMPSGFFPDNQLSESNLHSTSVALYTRGSYFLSSRLTLSGMAFKQFSPYRYPAVNPNFINHNREGMSFELNYRLFQNFHIGAQFNIIKSDGPFYPARLTQPVIDNYYR